MKKYKMLPVLVEAMQWFGAIEDVESLWNWMALSGSQNRLIAHDGRYYIIVDTKEIEIEPNDYIIKGKNGKFYSCKPHIFWKTYEEIKDDNYHEI